MGKSLPRPAAAAAAVAPTGPDAAVAAASVFVLASVDAGREDEAEEEGREGKEVDREEETGLMVVIKVRRPAHPLAFRSINIASCICRRRRGSSWLCAGEVACAL